MNICRDLPHSSLQEWAELLNSVDKELLLVGCS